MKNYYDFITACLDMNTLEELVLAERVNDATDCETWNLSEHDRKEAIHHAIGIMMNLEPLPAECK